MFGGCQHLAVKAGSAQQLSMAQDQNILHEQITAPIQFFQKSADMVRGYALRFRCSPGKGLLGIPEGKCLLFSRRRQEGLRHIPDIKYSGQKLIGSAGSGEIHRQWLL